MSLAEELLADLEDFEEDDTLQDITSHQDEEKEELKNEGNYSLKTLFQY